MYNVFSSCNEYIPMLTGATPQRQQFVIKRNLKRTSEHFTLLDRFRCDNMIDIEEELDSDIELDSQNQVNFQHKILGLTGKYT
jgi:hypothetical protein